MNEMPPSSEPARSPQPNRLYLAIARLCAIVLWLALLVGVVGHLTALVPQDVSSTPDEGVVTLQLNEGTRSGQESLARWVREDHSLQAVTEHLEGDQKFLRAYGILIPLVSLVTFLVLRLHSGERVALPLALTAILTIGAAALVDELLENPALDRIKVEAAASGRRGTLDTRMVNSALARDLDDLRLSAITKFLLASLGTAANVGLVAMMLRRQSWVARIGLSVVLVGIGVLWWRSALTNLPLVGAVEQVVGATQAGIESLLRLVPVSATWSLAVWLGLLVVSLVVADAASSARRNTGEAAAATIVAAHGERTSFVNRLLASLLQMLLVALAAPGIWLVILFFTSGIPLSVLISSLLATAVTGLLLMAALGGNESSAAVATSSRRRLGPALAGYAAILVAVAVTGIVTHQILTTAEQRAAESAAKLTARDADAWAEWSRMIGTQGELVLLKGPDEAPRPGTGGGGRANAALETTTVEVPLGDRRLFALGIGWLLAAAVVGIVALPFGLFARKASATPSDKKEVSSGQVLRRVAGCLLGAGFLWITAASVWLGASFVSRENPLGIGVPVVGALLSLGLFVRSQRQADARAAAAAATEKSFLRSLFSASGFWGSLMVVSLVGLFAWLWLKYAAYTPLLWVGAVAAALILLAFGLVVRTDRTTEKG